MTEYTEAVISGFAFGVIFCEVIVPLINRIFWRSK